MSDAWKPTEGDLGDTSWMNGNDQAAHARSWSDPNSIEYQQRQIINAKYQKNMTAAREKARIAAGKPEGYIQDPFEGGWIPGPPDKPAVSVSGEPAKWKWNPAEGRWNVAVSSQGRNLGDIPSIQIAMAGDEEWEKAAGKKMSVGDYLLYHKARERVEEGHQLGMINPRTGVGDMTHIFSDEYHKHITGREPGRKVNDWLATMPDGRPRDGDFSYRNGFPWEQEGYNERLWKLLQQGADSGPGLGGGSNNAGGNTGNFPGGPRPTGPQPNPWDNPTTQGTGSNGSQDYGPAPSIPSNDPYAGGRRYAGRGTDGVDWQMPLYGSSVQSDDAFNQWRASGINLANYMSMGNYPNPYTPRAPQIGGGGVPGGSDGGAVDPGNVNAPDPGLGDGGGDDHYMPNRPPGSEGGAHSSLAEYAAQMGGLYDANGQLINPADYFQYFQRWLAQSSQG